MELALALPLLLLILVGIFEFARAYSIKQSLVNAAREGARVAVVQQTLSETQVDSAVNYYLAANNIVADSTTISATEPDGTVKAFTAANPGDAVSVTVYDHYDFILIGPVLSLFSKTFRSGVDLGSRATMRKE